MHPLAECDYGGDRQPGAQALGQADVAKVDGQQRRQAGERQPPRGALRGGGAQAARAMPRST
jgi:hypothetical protein